MANCKHCQLPIADDKRLYCSVCYELLLNVMTVPDRCGHCHCPLDEKRKAIYELENEQGEVKEFCSVCFSLVEVVATSPYFVALVWAEEVRKSHKECE